MSLRGHVIFRLDWMDIRAPSMYHDVFPVTRYFGITSQADGCWIGVFASSTSTTPCYGNRIRFIANRSGNLLMQIDSLDECCCSFAQR